MSNVESPSRPTEYIFDVVGQTRTAGRALLLDCVIGDTLPKLTSVYDVENFERTPYSKRINARSTFDAIKLGASHNRMGQRFSSCRMQAMTTLPSS
jgi:hypothetical protein